MFSVILISRNLRLGLHLRLRGGAPPKGGKGAKGGAKDAGAKAASGGKDAPAEAHTEVAFPEARLEDQPAESGARHEFWVWSQNLKKEYEDGTREISEELLEKKSRKSKTLSVCAIPSILVCRVLDPTNYFEISHMRLSSGVMISE
jgi:hypothetical protein